MIHQYKLNGYNIVLDTASASVHAVDDVNIAIPAEEYGFAFQNGNDVAKAAADKIIDK